MRTHRVPTVTPRKDATANRGVGVVAHRARRCVLRAWLQRRLPHASRMAPRVVDNCIPERALPSDVGQLKRCEIALTAADRVRGQCRRRRSELTLASQEPGTVT